MPEKVNVLPELITWARTRAELDRDELAHKLGVKLETLDAWEEGEDSPTFRQAQNIAHSTYIPFGFLFLKRPPQQEPLPIPDLRAKGDRAPKQVSLNLLDTIKDVLYRQQWFQEYQLEQGAEKIAIVGKAKGMENVSRIVAAMKENLEIPDRPTRGNWEDYMRGLITKIESTGVLVMRNSMVQSNTNRNLEVDEFRGFAIANDYAPVIFINTADCPEARLFTLIHELAHIWLGESGVSDGEIGNEIRTEKLCNSIAAEFLAPSDEFSEYWKVDTSHWTQRVLALAAKFHVSKWVIARRAFELSFIQSDEYWAYINKIKEAHKNKKGTGAPSYYRMQTQKVSNRLAEAVVTEALSGKMLLRDAWRLIGVKPEKLKNYARTELSL